VATDAVFPVAYVGVEGGLVVVFADDPNGWSSAQTEQDSRPYAKIAHMPMIEPSNSQECIDFVKFAYDLSEKYKIPVFIRITTRVSHTRTVVKLGKLVKGDRKAKFEKDFDRYYNLPPKIVRMHEDIEKKIQKIRKEVSEKSDLNVLINQDVKGELGIITSGVSFNYVIDAMDRLKVKLPVLKLGITYPLPVKKIKDFIKKFKTIMVVEELEPFLETQIKALAKDVNPKLKILGKADEPYFSIAGELTPDIVNKALAKALGKKLKFDYDAHLEKYNKIEILKRPPGFCPGCPHRATFYVVKKVIRDDAIYGGDIGCYMMGIFPPFNASDFIMAMGSGMGITHGIKKAGEETGTKQKTVAFIGDGTFFHAGIPPLLNMVYNKSNILVVILDNRITAMTGHQKNPSSGKTGMGTPSDEIKIEDIARACGVKHVKVVDPFNTKELEATVREFAENDEVSVIVAKRICYLLESRMKRRKGIDIPRFEVTEKLPDQNEKVLKNYGCPAFYIDEDGKLMIDETICAGCASCVQFAPGKIRVKKKE
jgi:indolepyruvate ferredoxin oxidoreductase alpha subunit